MTQPEVQLETRGTRLNTILHTLAFEAYKDMQKVFDVLAEVGDEPCTLFCTIWDCNEDYRAKLRTLARKYFADQDIYEFIEKLDEIEAELDEMSD